MNTNPQNNLNQLSEEETEELMCSLLHKEGNWVDWGKKCQKLQKSGYNSQTIFEQTGFQASQQNLVIVAAQVYESIEKAGVSPDVLTYCLGPRSDILYEFRILNQEQRAAAAQLAREKSIEVDTAHEIAKAFQEFAHFSQLPSGFSLNPGDAMAYRCWKLARQKRDLAERSRLIAKGLKFAHSETARAKIEELLSDFTVVPSQAAPLMPVYRLELEEELPRIVPVVGSLPLKVADLAKVSALEALEPFRLVNFTASGACVPIPGWQVVLKAKDPVAICCQSEQLPKALPCKSEQVLVVVDRQSQAWDINNYYLVEQEENLAFQWFAESPNCPLLGQVVLVLRPKKILDENNLVEPWQMDD